MSRKKEILIIFELIVIFSILIFYSIHFFDDIFLDKPTVSKSDEFSVEIFDVNIESGEPAVLNESMFKVNLIE